MCALLKLQYWRQLKYFVIELFSHVAAYYSVLLVCVLCTVQSKTLHCAPHCVTPVFIIVPRAGEDT